MLLAFAYSINMGRLDAYVSRWQHCIIGSTNAEMQLLFYPKHQNLPDKRTTAHSLHSMYRKLST